MATCVCTKGALLAYNSPARLKRVFGYFDLLHEVQLFCKNGIETGIVGESTLGQQIPYIFVGNKNGNRMIVQGAIHAREHLTALLVVGLAKHLVKNNHLRMDGGIYFVPMTNPDGVRICQEGVGWIADKGVRANLVAINGGRDFSLWKANAQGVDVNVNFDAKWSKGKQNTFCKGAQNYVGNHPFSTAEARCLAEFTERLKPCVTLSYHLKGEEIYWEFGQKGHRKFADERYANAIAKYTGYKVVGAGGSVGGYKDWCIQKLKIPSFTIEVGNDKYAHPFPYSLYSTILQQNVDLPRRLLNSVVEERNTIKSLGWEDVLNG